MLPVVPAPPPRLASPRPIGVTLLEALVVIAILGILVAAGAPRLSRTVDAAAVTAQARSLASALRFARAEALKRGDWVTVCARAPGSEPPDCAPSAGTGWRPGWLVFVDGGRRGVLDGGDALLRLEPALAPSGGADGTMAAFTFGPAGTSLDAASHVLFHGASGQAVQLVCIARTGRARLAPPGQDTC